MNWIKLALEAGFEDAVLLNMDALEPRQEVRDMCSADRCRAFGTRWACPPACGSIEHCEKRMKAYTDGILVQTVGELEDDFDSEGIARANAEHKRRFAALARQARMIAGDCLPLSAGTCTRCEVCTYPDRPCRFPDKMLSSMEAYGLLVSEVCTRSGMPYNRGEKTITFTSCLLFNKKETDK